jgi:hypothetical protein
MGSNDHDAEVDESPAHDVILNDFFICKFLVSEAEWETVVENIFDSNKCNFPKTVDWDNCILFINRLNNITGLRFSLPSEAQWEFAARGGNLSKGFKYSGCNELTQVGWFGFEDHFMIFKLGNKKPNELGLFDMSGYMGEWCQDWYNKYQNELQINPQGPISGTERVIRGGCLVNEEKDCRSTARNSFIPSLKGIGINLFSFRLVFEPQKNRLRIPIAIQDYNIIVDGDFFCAIFGSIPIFDDNGQVINNDGITEVLANSEPWWTRCSIILIWLNDNEYEVRFITDPEWGKHEVNLNINTNLNGEVIGFECRHLDFIPLEAIDLLRENGFLIDSKYQNAIVYSDLKKIP